MDIGMKEVREEIDLIDRELVLLLARRQKCIETPTKFADVHALAHTRGARLGAAERAELIRAAATAATSGGRAAGGALEAAA